MDTPTQSLVKRIKSLLWRAGAMALAALLAYVAQNLGVLELNATTTTVIGLILGEASKFLNTPTK